MWFHNMSNIISELPTKLEWIMDLEFMALQFKFHICNIVVNNVGQTCKYFIKFRGKLPLFTFNVPSFVSL
jgi:hypothetical protein